MKKIESIGYFDGLSELGKKIADTIAAIQLIRTNRKSVNAEISERKYKIDFLEKRRKLLFGEMSQLEYRLFELDLDLEEKEALLFALLKKKSDTSEVTRRI